MAPSAALTQAVLLGTTDLPVNAGDVDAARVAARSAQTTGGATAKMPGTPAIADVTAALRSAFARTATGCPEPAGESLAQDLLADNGVRCAKVRVLALGFRPH